MKINHDSRQQGFAVLHIMPVILLIAIAFVAGSVYQAQQRKQDAARQAAASDAKKLAELTAKQQDESSAEEKEVEVPAPAPEQKPVEQPAPKPTTTTAKKKETAPTYTVVAIPTSSASVQAEQVVLTAKLPASYGGTCKALVKLPDGSNAMWFENAFGPADTCSVSVPRSKLSAGTEWKFYMYFKSSDGLTKGESTGNVFTL